MVATHVAAYKKELKNAWQLVRHTISNAAQGHEYEPELTSGFIRTWLEQAGAPEAEIQAALDELEGMVPCRRTRAVKRAVGIFRAEPDKRMMHLATKTLQLAEDTVTPIDFAAAGTTLDELHGIYSRQKLYCAESQYKAMVEMLGHVCRIRGRMQDDLTQAQAMPADIPGLDAGFLAEVDALFAKYAAPAPAPEVPEAT
ncbi:MAG: hypothetical protein EON60_14025 [Alphaproteobacteria bacterium]|nr:MAG: hypothetical protein EON60_14025 [Alphaproteobacteria bacterium]